MANCEMLDASTESGVISREVRATVVELPSTIAVESATEIDDESEAFEFGLAEDSTSELVVTAD